VVINVLFGFFGYVLYGDDVKGLVIDNVEGTVRARAAAAAAYTGAHSFADADADAGRWVRLAQW
jgi:hypothetical protein